MVPIYIGTSVFCLGLWICIFVKVLSFNILGIFKISMGSLISPFSQEALIKWRWGVQLHICSMKCLQAARIPSLSRSLSGWQVAGGCQVCVGNLHSGAENVYCRERTFALWSHLLLVTSRFLIFYHRKFLVDHKSNPLSPAAGGEQWCTAPPGWASASSVGQSTCALQNANSVLLKQC